MLIDRLRSFAYGRIPFRVNDLRGTIERTGGARNRGVFHGVKCLVAVVRELGPANVCCCFLSGNRSLGANMYQSAASGDVVNRRQLGKVVMNEIEDVFA